MIINTKREHIRLWVIFATLLFLLEPEWFSRLFGLLKKIFFPIFYALILSMILDLPTTFLETCFRNARKERIRRHARGYAQIVVWIVAFLILMLLFFLVVPKIYSSLEELFDLLPEYLNAAFLKIQKILVRFYPAEETDKLFESINTDSLFSFSGKQSPIFEAAVEITANLFSFLVRLLFILVFSAYLVGGKETLQKHAKSVLLIVLPKQKMNLLLTVTRIFHETFSSFLSRQCLESFLFGLICFVVLILFGFPYALPISVVIALTTLIPVIGSVIGGGVGFLLLLLIRPFQGFLFLAVYLILQNLEGNFIYPRIVGTSIGLPAIWSVFAVFAGGIIGGVWGVFLSVPFGAVCYRLFREYVRYRLKREGIEPSDLDAMFYEERYQTNLMTEKVQNNKIP